MISTERQRYDTIDVAKGIAMVMIILCHYRNSFGICTWMYYFEMGCPIFFVASGFGIASLIYKKFSGSINRKNIWKFYSSRFWAIAPAWYMACLLNFIMDRVSVVLTGDPLSFISNRDALSVICNILFIHGILPFCYNNVFLGGWYIGTLVILYALTPLIILLVSRWRNKVLFFSFSSIIAMLIWVPFYYLLNNGDIELSFFYRLFLVHYPEYLLGIILFLNLSLLNNTFSEKRKNILFFLGIVSFITAYCIWYAEIPLARYLSSWLTAISAFLLISFGVVIENNKTLKKPWIIKRIFICLGKNSLYVYLMHGYCVWTFVGLIKLLLSRTGIQYKDEILFFLLMPIVIVISGGLGILFGRVVKAGMKYIKKWSRRYETAIQ